MDLFSEISGSQCFSGLKNVIKDRHPHRITSQKTGKYASSHFSHLISRGRTLLTLHEREVRMEITACSPRSGGLRAADAHGTPMRECEALSNGTSWAKAIRRSPLHERDKCGISVMSRTHPFPTPITVTLSETVRFKKIRKQVDSWTDLLILDLVNELHPSDKASAVLHYQPQNNPQSNHL